ncbi:MAG: hypothetical protein RRC34_01615 [Lentisphaeria bacterium]|nr:hypothetical protein [Lentisphaeria bacterium]
MAGLNRGLMIFITLLAIGAAALSFLLFQKRTEFTDRASLLAETNAAMVKALDKESGTNVSRKVTFTPAEPALGGKESGTLSAIDFHTDKISGGSAFADNLKAAADLAEKVNQQRNTLAQTLDEIAYALKIEEGQVSVGDLKNASETDLYETASQKIKSLAVATQERTTDMINALLASSTILGHSMEVSMFQTRDSQRDENGNVVMTSFKHAAQLADFNAAVSAVNQRCQDYGDAIVQAIESINSFNWDTDPDRVRNKLSYSRALSSLAGDFTEINTLLVQGREDKAMVQKLNIDLREVKNELAVTKSDRDTLQTKVAEQTGIIADLRVKLATGGGPRGPWGGGDMELDKNLKGHIVQVNPEWNYVILDLGEDDVYESLPLVVSRGDEYIGKVMVSKVAKNICVAEIDSKMMKSPIQEGDVVFLPKGY